MRHLLNQGTRTSSCSFSPCDSTTTGSTSPSTGTGQCGFAERLGSDGWSQGEVKFGASTLPFLPSGKLTYQWKTTNFNRRYVFEWWISHCYISLPECILFIPGLSTCGFRFAWQHHGRADLGDFPGFWRKTPELMI